MSLIQKKCVEDIQIVRFAICFSPTLNTTFLNIIRIVTSLFAIEALYFYPRICLFHIIQAGIHSIHMMGLGGFGRSEYCIYQITWYFKSAHILVDENGHVRD